MFHESFINKVPVYFQENDNRANFFFGGIKNYIILSLEELISDVSTYLSGKVYEMGPHSGVQT